MLAFRNKIQPFSCQTLEEWILKIKIFTTDTGKLRVKGATSQVAGSLLVLDRTVIVLNPTVMTINGGHSFPPAWWWVRPTLVTPRTGCTSVPALPTLSCLSDDRYIFKKPCPALVCFLGPGVAPLTSQQPAERLSGDGSAETTVRTAPGPVYTTR